MVCVDCFRDKYKMSLWDFFCVSKDMGVESVYLTESIIRDLIQESQFVNSTEYKAKDGELGKYCDIKIYKR